MRRLIRTLAVAAILATAQAAAAAEPPSDPARKTAWGLYLTSPEAAAMKAAEGDAVLFVDVRDPIEIMFTGFTDVVDVNVPFLLSNPGKGNAEKSVFAMEQNADFAAGIEAALAARGLDKSSPVILMCRSGGERGAPSAKALEPFGSAKVYVVVDGFEGETSRDQPGAPARTVNGWRNAGLPWSYKLDPEKMWRRP